MKVSGRWLRAAALAAVVASAACWPVVAEAVPAPTLYVSAFLERAVRAYSLNADGTLGDQLFGSPFPIAQVFSEAAVVSPDGRRLYVTDRWQPGQLNGFAIQSDGSLTPLPGSPYPTDGNYPVGLAFTPDGRYLYATNYNALIPFTATTVGSVKAFAVRADGSLTSVPGPSTFATSGLEPIGIVTTPDGRSLVVTNNKSPNVDHYAINRDGSLTPLRPIPSGASGSDGIAISPDGSHLYIDNASAQIITYALDRHEHATRVGAPVSTGGGELSIFLAMTRDGRRLWASNFANGTITGFAVSANGSPTPLPSGPTRTGGLEPEAIAISADMRYLYVANRGSSTASAFSIAADGALTQLPRSPYFTGANSPGYSGITITPGYSPTARLKVRLTRRLTIRLSAAASTDPRGHITRFAWDFGDGTRVITAGTTTSVTHHYRRAGRYRVTVVAIGSDGCSDQPGFTGRTTGCANAGGAKAAHWVLAR